MDLKGMGVDGRGVDSYDSGLAQAGVCFENGNENLSSVKCG